MGRDGQWHAGVWRGDGKSAVTAINVLPCTDVYRGNVWAPLLRDAVQTRVQKCINDVCSSLLHNEG